MVGRLFMNHTDVDAPDQLVCRQVDDMPICYTASKRKEGLMQHVYEVKVN
jgi:hypothetical protein